MTRIWVKGYTKADGTKVPGHYREISRSSQASALTSRRKKIARQFSSFEKKSKGIDIASPAWNKIEKEMKPLVKKSRRNAARRSALSKSTGYWI